MTSAVRGDPMDPRQRLLQVLACSALGPGLDGVLLFDLEPEMVAPVTDAFARLLTLRNGRPVRRTMLGSVTGDDELWLRPRLRHEDVGLNFSLAPGPLVDSGTETSTLVVVPDLVRLSLPGMRAAVQLLGADVAAVERSGFRARWRPRARWLAACRQSEVGRLSPHLLDRFPIRLNAAGLVPEQLLDELTAGDEPSRPGTRATASGLTTPDGPRHLRPTPVSAVVPEPAVVAGPDPDLGTSHTPDHPRPVHTPALSELPEGWGEALTAAGLVRVVCPLTEEAAVRAVGLFDGDGGSRRALGLARLARALAVLGGAERCDVERVDEAARLIGVAARPVYPPGAGVPADGGPVGSGGAPEGRSLPEPPRPDPAPDDGGPGEQVPGTAVALTAAPAEALDTFAADAGEGVGSPFPEDDAQYLREFAPLRIPWQRRPEPSSARGPVIGVRPASALRDLAFVASIIEAAKHQNLPARRALRADGDGRLVVLPGDFRSYARLPVAERMLVLLLDHTCRRGWDWQPALAPYFQWAYAGRASVCVVEVGGLDAVHELRAEHFVARSVLDPRVGRALHRLAGRSSPLAHGLVVTDQLLRRAFQQRSNLVEAWLVVVTDGRGNVPLDTGAGGRIAAPVRRAGIEDALSAAERIGAMGRMRLHSVVVDAARPPHPDLTFQLAEALGGVTVAGLSTQGVADVR
ncbi:magnesium chelatase [Streptomyces sp. C1-1]|uniref:magnesium chelatase n=1 Tax=Streptomyces sp. C1-1 TaxID=3231173 RepID=UPI003D01D1C4